MRTSDDMRLFMGSKSYQPTSSSVFGNRPQAFSDFVRRRPGELFLNDSIAQKNQIGP